MQRQNHHIHIIREKQLFTVHSIIAAHKVPVRKHDSLGLFCGSRCKKQIIHRIRINLSIQISAISAFYQSLPFIQKIHQQYACLRRKIHGNYHRKCGRLLRKNFFNHLCTFLVIENRFSLAPVETAYNFFFLQRFIKRHSHADATACSKVCKTPVVAVFTDNCNTFILIAAINKCCTQMPHSVKEFCISGIDIIDFFGFFILDFRHKSHFVRVLFCWSLKQVAQITKFMKFLF